MKTAISLPDDLFAAAEALAGRLGVSRNELYTTAVAEFLAKHTTSELTDRLNRVYAAEPGALDPGLRRVQQRSLRPEAW
jgi:metal-responsive CopG/Arc/MetJ family transcriptional regulator